MRLEFNSKIALPAGEGRGGGTKVNALVDIQIGFGVDVILFQDIYSNTIWGIPPALPPRTSLPFSISHEN